jgi:hypothetical protein
MIQLIVQYAGQAMRGIIAFSYSKWRYLMVVVVEVEEEEEEEKSFTGCCPL